MCVHTILYIRVRTRVAAPCDTELLGTRAAKHASARASAIKHSQARRLSSSTAIERVSAAPAAPGDLIPFKTTNQTLHLNDIFAKTRDICRTLCMLHKHKRAGRSAHRCRFESCLSQSDYLSLPRPRGLTDKASVSEAEDCGFESRRG